MHFPVSGDLASFKKGIPPQCITNQNKQSGFKPNAFLPIIERVGQQVQEISRKARSIRLQALAGCA